MWPALTFGLAAFGSIFSIVDPIAALPVYLALAGRETEANRRRIATRYDRHANNYLAAIALAATVAEWTK